jgi:hypothetical protein
MNPLQQMELARLDHQDKLQAAQRNRLASPLSWKSLFAFAPLAHKQARGDKSKPVSIQCDIQCDTVAVN